MGQALLNDKIHEILSLFFIKPDLYYETILVHLTVRLNKQKVILQNIPNPCAQEGLTPMDVYEFLLKY
ncbi:MAG: hypothetical protein B6240_03555 [Desulfobacteraceae bacterium 4572_87]|nr:MAG: hypothetical protein B6240_03555 [Desulfobacteraceae bacterium 4572_87]